MHPLLFQIGDVKVLSYPAFQVLAFAASILVILVLARRRGLPRAETAAFLVFGIIVALAGAKIYVWIESAIRHPAGGSGLTDFGIAHGGHSYYGSLLAVIPFAFWYMRRFQLPLWKTADLAAVGTALGFAVARIGCFLTGCCYGLPSSLPWAVLFPGHSVSVHPTQLYESAANVINFAVLLAVLRRKKFDGQVIALDAMINSAARFLIEFLRGDPARPWLFPGGWGGLTVTHLLGAAGFIAGAVLWRVLRKKAGAHA